MRVIKVGAAVCVGAIVVVAASPVSAKPIEQERYTFQDSDTFTDTECGEPITIDYTAEFSGLFKLKPGRHGDPTPLISDNYSGVETYTNVPNGKTATLRHQGLFKDLRVEHVEGTLYKYTAIEAGRPVVVIGPDGKKLIFDRGRIRYTVLIDTQGDADPGNDVFVGEVAAPDVAGPHPIFFEEADFCDLLDVLR